MEYRFVDAVGKTTIFRADESEAKRINHFYMTMLCRNLRGIMPLCIYYTESTGLDIPGERSREMAEIIFSAEHNSVTYDITITLSPIRLEQEQGLEAIVKPQVLSINLTLLRQKRQPETGQPETAKKYKCTGTTAVSYDQPNISPISAKHTIRGCVQKSAGYAGDAKTPKGRHYPRCVTLSPCMIDRQLSSAGLSLSRITPSPDEIIRYYSGLRKSLAYFYSGFP